MRIFHNKRAVSISKDFEDLNLNRTRRFDDCAVGY